MLPSVLPQGFRFHLMPEAASQPCWLRLSHGGDESIHVLAILAESVSSPQMGGSPLLPAGPDCSVHHQLSLHSPATLLLALPAGAFPRLLNSTEKVTLTDYTEDSCSASPETVTHNLPVLDLKQEQRMSQNHNLAHVFYIINRPGTMLVASSS